ncbi:MAG TPA: helix-turn-helix domain-containing protein [Solirubrobacteraceae bacterium]|nr:helix-turn-helix domain-containing protein [Solirubrobacteraceae bacterium]
MRRQAAMVRDADELAIHSIVESALRDHALIATEMASQIAAQVDAYQHALDPQALLLDTERSCDAHIQNFLRSVGRDGESLELDFTAASVAQRVRQAIPLEAVLHAYRVGHHVLWTYLRDRAQDSERGPIAITTLVDPMLRYIDAVSTVVAEGYLREQQHALADADRVRRDVLEQLLAQAPEAVGFAAAQGIELDADAPHHILLARRAVQEQGDLRAICNEIVRLFGRDAPLVVIRQETAAALVRGGDRSTLDRARRLADGFAGTERIRVGVSLTSTILELGEAYRQAERALQVANDLESVVALGGMASIDYLVAAADEVAKALVPSEVARLASSSRPTDEALISTFEVYVGNGLNVQRTATALPAHPNTVHSRLKRLAERTGYDLRDQQDILRLVVDLQLVG